MRTTILAYVIAAVGLLMLIFGAWGMIVLNNAEIDVALTDEAIVFALIGGGFAMIGVAQTDPLGLSARDASPVPPISLSFAPTSHN